MKETQLEPNERFAKPACYSSSLKYVFIHIPKCAGTSMHQALRSLHERQSVRVEDRKYHKHAKASEVRPVLGRAWDDAFKFAFVRNPWDLMVSSYHWWLTHAPNFPRLAADAARIQKLGSFSAFVQSEYGSEMLNECHGRDLLDWICDGNKIIVDFVGKYETLEADWRQVCQALGVASIALPQANQVPRENYRSFYDATSKRLVADRFARSIELFGYQF